MDIISVQVNLILIKCWLGKIVIECLINFNYVSTTCTESNFQFD